MNPPSASSNWKQSAAHFGLLMAFQSPRDIKQVLDWDWPRQELGEKPEAAIKRFVEEGMLVPATLEEGLSRLFQVAELKKLLIERNLPTRGSKVELIERLVVHDPNGMKKVVGNTILKCSTTAISLIEERKQKIERETAVAQKMTYEAFKASNPKEACRIYEAFKRYSADASYHASIFDVEELQFILTSNPKILSGLTEHNLKAARLAACMESLWKNIKAETWLPGDFSSPFKNNRTPINYILKHSEFQKQLSNMSEFGDKVKIVFRGNDIHSCEKCLALSGKIFTIYDVPELPMLGCTSETGCMCSLDTVYEDDDDDLEEDDSDDGGVSLTDLTDENLALLENPIGTLRLLKQMLNEGLIKQSDYDEKKKEILSRL